MQTSKSGTEVLQGPQTAHQATSSAYPATLLQCSRYHLPCFATSAFSQTSRHSWSACAAAIPLDCSYISSECFNTTSIWLSTFFEVSSKCLVRSSTEVIDSRMSFEFCSRYSDLSSILSSLSFAYLAASCKSFTSLCVSCLNNCTLESIKNQK